MNYQGWFRRLGAFLVLPAMLLFAFSPLKTRPVKYKDRFGSVLTIFPNCKDDGFSFTVVRTSETCAEKIRGSVGSGNKRYSENDLVLIFHRRIHAIEIIEEGNYMHGTSCGRFSGTYKKMGYE